MRNRRLESRLVSEFLPLKKKKNATALKIQHLSASSIARIFVQSNLGGNKPRVRALAFVQHNPAKIQKQMLR